MMVALSPAAILMASAADFSSALDAHVLPKSLTTSVSPAKAGMQKIKNISKHWIRAFAEMTWALS